MHVPEAKVCLARTAGEDLLVASADKPFRFPATFTFVVRSFTVLDGIGKSLNPRFDISEIAAPYARGLLLEARPQFAKLAEEVRKRAAKQVGFAKPPGVLHPTAQLSAGSCSLCCCSAVALDCPAACRQFFRCAVNLLPLARRLQMHSRVASCPAATAQQHRSSAAIRMRLLTIITSCSQCRQPHCQMSRLGSACHATRTAAVSQGAVQVAKV